MAWKSRRVAKEAARGAGKSLLFFRLFFGGVFAALLLTAVAPQSRRYDGRTTTFSPEGRLYQVEYAMEAISHAGAALGILAQDGVVLAAEKLVTSKLLDSMGSEKLYLIDDHIACVVSGITADANILVSQSRVAAQQYLLTYHEPMPVGE